MTLYLVVHTPHEEETDVLRPPSRLVDLAREHGDEGSKPRWLRSWSPDLHDDRMFTLWDSESADAIIKVIHDYGFLDNMDAKPLQVEEWGPADVIASAGNNGSL
jgi:hypothetical protein